MYCDTPGMVSHPEIEVQRSSTNQLTAANRGAGLKPARFDTAFGLLSMLY